jgi:hypothetical protein
MMRRLRKVVSAAFLGLGAALAMAVGVVFPIPPVIALPRRRRMDRTELLQRAPVGLTVDLSVPEVQAWAVDLARSSRRR